MKVAVGDLELRRVVDQKLLRALEAGDGPRVRAMISNLRPMSIR